MVDDVSCSDGTKTVSTMMKTKTETVTF